MHTEQERREVVDIPLRPDLGFARPHERRAENRLDLQFACRLKLSVPTAPALQVAVVPARAKIRDFFFTRSFE